MNKKLILIALSSMMFCSASYAQKVIKDGSAVIIDCSNMNPKFYDSNKKPQGTSATNTSLGPNNATDIASPQSNAKVYQKFEVSPVDNGGGPFTWLATLSVCNTINLNGTGWRVPTKRELILMWILKEKLVANGITPFDAVYYWSATQQTAEYAWIVDFGTNNLGAVVTRTKTNNNKVRCVREL